MRAPACIAGIGETSYVRRGGPAASSLILEACERALADAGLEAGDVDGIATERALVTHYIDHDELALTLGIGDHLSLAVGTYGAGIAGSVLAGAGAIEQGDATAVLCYFGADWGTTNGAYTATDRDESPKGAFELPYGFYGQPVHHAHIASRYTHEYGVDLTPALGAIATRFRSHAVLNGGAQRGDPLSMEEYLAAPVVADPLRIPDCCLLTDGAAAVVLTSADRARSLPRRPVFVLGGRYEAAPLPLDHFFSQSRDYLAWPTAGAATTRALRSAGVELADIDFLELYDCFTLTVLTELESMGFCERGEGADLIGDGERIAIGGDLPINTHGGLLSHDYMLGMSHIVEATRQLRGDGGACQVEGATVGLVGLLTAGEFGTLVVGNEVP